ncbi:LamG-like jellyroll fold domain-containing protein [Streptomyces sp. NPDC005901]|uniref:LamG-like jellyroll fold domain-containing protein n=1 Tax=Streptomyces sp. NPDC005901 TaxID=3157171 RepID=UPI0033EA9BB9
MPGGPFGSDQSAPHQLHTLSNHSNWPYVGNSCWPLSAESQTLSLYVNGSLSTRGHYAGTSWNANGPVEIGRRLYRGSYGEYANAQISDVRLWNNALPAADAAAPGDIPRVSGLN